MEEQPGRSTGCVAQAKNLVAWNRFRLLPGLCGAWSRFANDGTSKLPCARPFKPQVMGFQDAVIAFLPKVLAVAEGRNFSQPQQIIICGHQGQLLWICPVGSLRDSASLWQKGLTRPTNKKAATVVATFSREN